MRILHIHAHPDDAEIFAAGTLALLAERGHQVTIVTMTPGDCGSKHHSAEEIAGIRRKEAAHAASVIGADYFCAEFRDLSIFEDDASRRRVTAMLRRAQPDLVLTPPPIDYHCDHEATHRLVRDACFAAPCPNYSTAQFGEWEPLAHIPHLYLDDPAEGSDREGQPDVPDFVVDISSVLGKKREMLARHESQRLWLLEHHGMDDYLKTMEEWSARVGQFAGFAFGEGFRIYRHHPYPQTPLLEELLGAELVKRVRP
jgi:LmbE family N-acetylglucosaminyl deacetylase